MLISGKPEISAGLMVRDALLRNAPHHEVQRHLIRGWLAYFFKCLAKKSSVRGQAISALFLS